MPERFIVGDFSGAESREVAFTGARMRGVILVDVDIDGLRDLTALETTDGC